MKTHTLLIFSILMIVLGSCGNQGNENIPSDVVTNPQSASGETAGALPVIEFEKELHDFGKLIAGEKAVYTFKFENKGSADLVISQVNSSCGCTVPRFPKEAIAPGESGSIKVTFDSSGRKGMQNKAVTVVSNCQPNQTIIRIKAQVITP